MEQGIFVLGGTIIPMLQHDGCMALMECIYNEITLQVYLDANKTAYGELYLDDGETMNYAEG